MSDLKPCPHEDESGNTHFLEWPQPTGNVWNPWIAVCSKCGKTVGEIIREGRAPRFSPEEREALDSAVKLLDYYASSCPPGFSGTAVRITEAYELEAEIVRKMLEDSQPEGGSK